MDQTSTGSGVRDGPPPPWERMPPPPLPPLRVPAVDPTGLVGNAPAMRRLRETIRRYAPTGATVLIRGETGTGKELVARALHALSHRARGPFVATNVATFRPELLASELFGHERGAFTGAVMRHRGLFEQAHAGTLFLDEIGELPFDAQAQLLRVLETGEVRALGSERPREARPRLVVASHCDLGAMVAAGYFRADLYYRLHVLPLDVAPLRHRVEDIPLLAAHILDRLRGEVGERTLAGEVALPLKTYGWPGNVRQLASVIRRAAIQSDASVLGLDAIGDALALERPGSKLVTEAAYVTTLQAVFQASGGRISPTARRLGVARSTVRNHLRRFQIRFEPPQ